jgi:hypothetical protein
MAPQEALENLKRIVLIKTLNKVQIEQTES